MSKKPSYYTEVMRETLRLSEDELNSTMLDQGRRYLEELLEHDPVGREQLLATPNYWKWWKHQFDVRNMRIVREQKVLEDRHFYDKWLRARLTMFFHLIHDGEALAHEVRLAGHVEKVYNKIRHAR